MILWGFASGIYRLSKALLGFFVYYDTGELKGTCTYKQDSEPPMRNTGTGELDWIDPGPLRLDRTGHRLKATTAVRTFRTSEPSTTSCQMQNLQVLQRTAGT